MIRLAVFGANELSWDEIGARLRGAIFIDANAAPLQACEAAVFFAPPRADDPAIEQFLKAGKHVLLIANRCWPAAELKLQCGMAIEAGGRFALANPDRYLPSRQLIRQQLDAGKLGEPGLIRLHRWEAAATLDSDPTGALLRDLDVVMWLFGKAPNLVYAVTHCGSVQVHLGFPGNGMAVLAHARQLPTGPGYCSLSLIASGGAAYADDHQNAQLLYQGDSPRAICADEGWRCWPALVQDFVAAVQDPRVATPSSVKAWQNVLAVEDAVRTSLRMRMAVVPE